MLLPRFALLFAVIPGLLTISLGLDARWRGRDLGELELQRQLQAEALTQLSTQDLAQLGGRLSLRGLEIRDRAGRILAAWQQVPGVLRGWWGQPQRWVEPRSGAEVHYWRGASPSVAWLWVALGVAWSAFMLLAWHQLAKWRPARLSTASAWLPPQAPQAAPTFQSESAYQDLDAADLAMVHVDNDARVLDANAVFCSWVGRNLSTLRGQRLEQVLSVCDGQGRRVESPWDQLTVGQLSREEWGLPSASKVVAMLRVPAAAQGWRLVLVDVSSRHGATQELGQRSALLGHILDVLPVGVLVTDTDGRVRLSNLTAERLFAWAPGELEGEEITKLMPVPFLNQPDIQLQDYRGQGAETGTALPKVVGWRKDATTFPVNLKVEDLADHSGGLLVLVEDQTEALQTLAAQSRLGRLFDQTAEEVLILDARSLYVREANRGAQENLGYTLAQLRRMTLFHLAPELDASRTDPQLAALRGGEQRELRLNTMFKRQDHSSYPVALSLTCSREEEPPVLMLLAHDVTALRAAENRLAWMTRHDSLSRLPNRSAALEELARAARDHQDYWVGLVSILDLAPINIREGFEQGDVVIATVAERLVEIFPQSRFCARWSGATYMLLFDTLPPALDEALTTLSAPVEIASGLMKPELAMGVGPLHQRVDMCLSTANAALVEMIAQGGGLKIEPPSRQAVAE